MATMDPQNATTFASPAADASHGSFAEFPIVDTVLQTVSSMSAWQIALTIFLGLVVYDQVNYIIKKGSIVGPAFKIPFMGPFLESMNPKFEEYANKWASGELSCVSVFHKFVVIASTRDMSRKIFNSPAFARPCVVDVAHKLLGADSWVFLDGKAHIDFRKGLNGLFTRSALDIYLPGQEDVYRTYFQQFLKVTEDAGGKPVPFMGEFREVTCAAALRTFCGHYITDAGVKQIADDYYMITEALELVNFPIIIPYTRTWYGKKAADMVLAEFSRCAAKSKVRMAAGGETNCIMDQWIKLILESMAYTTRVASGASMEGIEKPYPLLREFSDYEIAQTIFTFLFASQDATSSAVTYLFQIMAQRPDVLDKVRAENLALRAGDRSKRVNMDDMDKLVYTRGVIRELLRYRPPVLMVPYMTKKAFPLTDTYTVPKGAMVIPTTYPAMRDPEVYPDPDTYDPMRWVTGDADVRGAKNFLVFGTGAHYCIGQVYVQRNLMLMVGMASMYVDWVHHPTPLSEKIKVFATIFPMDDCPLTFTARPEEANKLENEN